MSELPAASAASPLRLSYLADPRELTVLRRRVASWAQQVGLDADVLVDLQLALGEAVANGVEHAYRDAEPGRVDVDLRLRPDGPGVVLVCVRDRGRWRPPALRRGHRGRGLHMIRQLARRVRVLTDPGGTEVSFEIPLSA